MLEGLAEYNPIELTGRISEKKREENINIFQDPSTHCRVLIGNPKVGGVGINLHDTDGRFPRKMYIFPTYDIKSIIINNLLSLSIIN